MRPANSASMQEAAQERVGEICQMADALRIPLHAMVELTYRCTVDCVHCYCQHLRNTDGREELRTVEWKQVLDELAELGVFHLTLTGGEIFLRQDFWEIAHHAKALHFSMTLFTNGTLLTPEQADRLAELRPTSIEMSLLGATEATHDRLAGMPGAWRRMMRGAELLRKRHLAFVFKTTLMQENFHEQRDLERIAKAYGCRAHKCGTEVSPRNDGDRNPQRYQIGQRAMFDYYISDAGGEIALPSQQPTRERSKQKSTCGAGVTGCAVNPYGDLLPCLQLLLPFGNVRERSLPDMWERPPEWIARLRETKAYGQIPACAQCDLLDYCRRCHGLAQLDAGAWDACDRQARRTAEVVRAVVNYKRAGAVPDFADTVREMPVNVHGALQNQGGTA
jgi:radical SAM protein with 4Fe4S-binding SPASM domain